MIKFLDIEFVKKIHDDNIEMFGGSFGLRNESLLISAIKMPMQSFGGSFLHDFPFEMSAAYLFHISKNHAFVDGNKRTALGAYLTFLRMNNLKFIGDHKELEEVVIRTATGELNKTQIAKFLSENVKKVN